MPIRAAAPGLKRCAPPYSTWTGRRPAVPARRSRSRWWSASSSDSSTGCRASVSGGSAMAAPIPPPGSAVRLQVCLDEPQPLVHPAGDLGEDVRGVRIAELAGLVDGCPGELAVRGQGGGQGVHVLVPLGDVGRVLGQLARLHREAGSALRDATEL